MRHFSTLMKLIPAMSILHGRIAIVNGGRYEYLQNSEGEFRNPVKLARELPGDEIFIMDIDGLERSSPNLKTIKKIAAFKDIWLDAGSQDSEDMMDLFVSDAAEVVLGTKALESLEELRDAAEMSAQIIFSIDYDGRILSPVDEINSMDISGIIDAVKDFRIDTVILMDLGSHRDKTPVDLGIIRQLADAFEDVYISAYTIRDDYDALEEAGVKGIIRDFRTIQEAGE